jgi:hypothetical protein
MLETAEFAANRYPAPPIYVAVPTWQHYPVLIWLVDDILRITKVMLMSLSIYRGNQELHLNLSSTIRGRRYYTELTARKAPLIGPPPATPIASNLNHGTSTQGANMRHLLVCLHSVPRVFY